jgi:hypothetical protein
MLAQRKRGSVGQFLAEVEVDVFYIVAILSENVERVVRHRLATPQRDLTQEATTAPRDVLQNWAL